MEGGPPLALTWAPSETNGWGLIGLAIATEMIARGRLPVFLEEPPAGHLSPATLARLEPILGQTRQAAGAIAQAGDQPVRFSVEVLHNLGNAFLPAFAMQHVRGSRTHGLIAFEDTAWTETERRHAAQFETFIAISSYNLALMQEWGLDARLALQGVDSATFRPLPRRGRFAGRFAIFSGGKLEFRKGQDLVLAAFKIFHQRHPEALLVTAWQSPWPSVAATMVESALVDGPPEIIADRVDVAGWAGRHGVAADAVIDCGLLSRAEIPPLMAECDVALFPNRCEGGTNVVANEAMACGLASILSANTGHLDIMGEGLCYGLADQRPLAEAHGRRRGWRDSSVEEMLAVLERVYTDPEGAKAIGLAGSEAIRRRRTWPSFAQACLDGLADPKAGHPPLDPMPAWD